MAQAVAQADTIVRARWVIPVEGETAVLENHAVIIRDGVIADILSNETVDTRWRSENDLTLDQHALLPGLVNAHTHSAMNLFRGLADDLPLMTWLEEHIWPAEGQWVSEAFVHDGSRFACAEMIRSGTTCFADMYFFPDAIARAAHEAGLRATVFSPLLDFPTPMAQGPDEYLRLAVAAHDQWRHEPLVNIAFGPHAPYTVSDAPLQKVLTYAEELDAPIMMHVHETAGEVSMAVENTGERPLGRLDALGLLSPRLMAVHMTQLTDDEISLLAETGVSVIHCPESNLKLASGFCPVERLRQAGVNVALGTDGAASNNDLDMFAEMRTAALLAKGVAGAADALPAQAALAMATIAGARALGLDQQTGSLVIGKQADIIAVDLGQLESQPVYDPLAQLVYTCSRDQVTHSFVAGRCLMAERQLTTLNEARIGRDARTWGERIRAGQQNGDAG